MPWELLTATVRTCLYQQHHSLSTIVQFISRILQILPEIVECVLRNLQNVVDTMCD
jgi:hypothetical protein